MNGPRLSIIPAGAVTDRTLEPRDLQVLCLLGRHLDKLGWCVRSQVKMAAELGCGRSSVQRSLERLAEAGWVEKRRRDVALRTDDKNADPSQPSAAYAYRVRLDGDLATDEIENPALDDGDDQVGQADDTSDATCANDGDYPQGVPTGGHGCPAMDGHGCPPIAGHITPSLNDKPERETRARDRLARGLIDFEARWPSAASDDRQRVAYAWAELSDEEREAAIGAIAAFVDNQKRLGRKGVPAGWKYLEEKRWTLLEKPELEQRTVGTHAPDSIEAKAIKVAYELAGKSSSIAKFMRQRDGSISYRGKVTEQLLALAQAPPWVDWLPLSRQQAYAWTTLIDAYVLIETRKRLREGDRAPWPWPPSKDGKIYAGTGPPDTLMTEDDEAALAEFK